MGVVTEDTLADAFRDPINLALLDGIGEGFRAERFGLLVMPQAGPDGVDFASASMDAAILLGMSRNGAYDAIREGQIPHFKVGRCIRVPSAALRSMLQIPGSSSEAA